MNAPQTSRFSRWYHLLRHHRTDQIWRRAKKLVAGKLWRPSLSKVEEQLAHSASVREELSPLRSCCARRVGRETSTTANLATPEFTFLGETRTLNWPIDWRCSSVAPVSHLWRFQLHYQDALWPLLRVDEGLLWKHVADWTAAHERPTRASMQDGWHPFCLARRQANWLQWWAHSPPPEPVREVLFRSVARQAAYLLDHLEWDLRGNHLLFNLWAVALASAFFDGPLGERLLAVIDAHLPEQIEEQLAEGSEHFERATAYHIEVAELFLDLRDVLKPFRPRLSAQCGSIASRMTDLIVGISHPDGDPPLFGDSTLSVRPILDSLKRNLVNSLDSPSSLQAQARMYGDYWVWRHQDDCLIFDTGPVGADELPAHAHCDLLGFEASIGGHKLFIDSGVASYDDNDDRRYCRSTAAHNTLEIDGISQCDVWGKFRMGYRGHPQLLDEGHEGGNWWCQASHDAYRRLHVPLVARHFECRDDGTWACMDVLWGTGQHELVSRLHLHPNVTVVTLESPAVVLKVGEQQVRITFEGLDGVLSTTTGRYCPQFGQVLPCPVLEWRRHTKVPAVVKWTLTREATRSLDELQSPDSPSPVDRLLPNSLTA